MQTVMIYLIGLGGVGKYTIAQHIAHHGYKVIDNHLINNPILSLIDLDGTTPISPTAWFAISRIRRAVFDFIMLDYEKNYVLTNELLETDSGLYERVMEIADARESLFVPVKLTIVKAEHIKRVTSPGRAERFKSTSTEDARLDQQLISISHPHLLELDVTNLTAQEAAEKILTHTEKIQKLNK
ncbi:hypothetical protein K2X40_05105 [Candidatus Babeliales bacterium]|nr:hypothetical protein [Candidatus Babeliales bacterium]